jgi:hypothetical protein
VRLPSEFPAREASVIRNPTGGLTGALRLTGGAFDSTMLNKSLVLPSMLVLEWPVA